MKIIKGLAVFSVVWILFAACFSTPEFSNVPLISFDPKNDGNILYFVPSPSDTSSIKDSIVFDITFKDGDGDLGLDPTESDTPYNSKNYYLADGNGGLQAIGTFTGEVTVGGSVVGVLSPVLDVSSGYKGKLVTNRTRKQPAYATLPVYPSIYPCRNYDYSFDSVFILGPDTAIFNKTYNIKRIIKTTNPTIYVLQDTLYSQPNPNSINITVGFLQEQADGSYETFDWRQQYCEDFNQRFPVLADKSRPLQGKLRYGMASRGFTSIFGTRNIELKVQIKDRALHISNEITIGPFSLNSIRKR